MGRKQQTVTIEGFTYELAHIGAVEGRSLVLLFLRLLGRFAPLFVKAKTARDAGKLDASVIEDIGFAINSVDPKDLEPLWDAFSRHAQVRGKDGKTRENLHEVFDEHFAGEYFAMVHFFIEAAKLNFGDFLAKALAQASELQGTTPTP